MRSRFPRLLMAAAVLAGLALGFAPLAQAQGFGERNTVGKEQARAGQFLRGKLRSIQPEGAGVRIVSHGGELYYRKRSLGPSAPLVHGTSVFLSVGDAIVFSDHHGGQEYTVRKRLADRVVLDYAVYSSGIAGNGTDTGTLELAYRK